MVLQVPTMPQNSSGHGHASSPAALVGPHPHSPAVQSQGAAVVQSHAHPLAPMAPSQGAQFQRLKVHFSYVYILLNVQEIKISTCTKYRIKWRYDGLN